VLGGEDSHQDRRPSGQPCGPHVVDGAVVAGAGLVREGPVLGQSRTEAMGAGRVGQEPPVNRSGPGAWRASPRTNRSYVRPRARGLEVSVTRPGSAEFSSGSHRSSRVTRSPTQRQKRDRVRAAELVQQEIGRPVVAVVDGGRAEVRALCAAGKRRVVDLGSTCGSGVRRSFVLATGHSPFSALNSSNHPVCLT
jgi:hypothetical protein